MKPFILIATRADDAIADEEYEAILRFGGLKPDELRRIRLEQHPMPEIDLNDYSGIIVGGSPFNSTDDPAAKSETQLRVESELSSLLDRVVEQDFPFLGACYGVGTLGIHQGGVVDGTYAEPAGAVTVTVSDEGAVDPIFAGMPKSFDAFVGHKEALTVVPAHAVVLAGSLTCPVQMFKVGENVYATQFHPELDIPGIIRRMTAYRHEGYFDSDELDARIAEVSEANVAESSRVLRNFVTRYAKNEVHADIFRA